MYIELKNINKTFGDYKASRNVSFGIEKGKLIGLLGPSGSGKTTIAKELQQRFGRNTMLISQDVIRRDMLRVKDGENTPALPLMKELLVYGSSHSDICNTVINN